MGSTSRGAGLRVFRAQLLILAALSATGCIKKPKARTCPTGVYCPAGSTCAAREPICIWDSCGDGVLDAGEICDDGNKTDGDGCSADCKSNETCGNIIVDTATGEQCDLGAHNGERGSGCTHGCKFVGLCGNGVVDLDLDEQCDDEGESPTCNADCSAARCGDGKVNKTAGEECDEGSANSYDGDCLPTCKSNTCGDGFKDLTKSPTTGLPKEGCDFGPDTGVLDCPYQTIMTSCEVCNTSCQLVSGAIHYCGDHTIDSGNEVCDDGANNGNTACDYGVHSCQICNATCTELVTQSGPYCGDHTIDAGHEACDDGANNGATSCAYGVQSCQICNATCTAQATWTGPYCGDYQVTNSEQCDDRYSFACGTCGAPASTSACHNVARAPAKGTITVKKAGGSVDGVTFTLDDGSGIDPPVTFELDWQGDGSCATGNTCINVQGLTTTIPLAAQIQTVINSTSALGIHATLPSNSSTLTLTNTYGGYAAGAGISGNTPSIPTSDSTVIADIDHGMTGGVGCTPGEACLAPADCVSNACSSGTCGQ